jgi:nucleotide-binding universal stress UspA family protein
MGKILCSTRGGDASIRTQEAAIRRAKAEGDELVFFYAFDMEFLVQADFVVRSDVVLDEMDKMAHFLMSMAVERAQKEAVEARYVIRHGRFVEELKAAIEEEEATLVVLGRPADDRSAFDPHRLEELAQSVEAETGVKVWIPSFESPPAD